MQITEARDLDSITFIGAGIATSYALLSLLKEMGQKSANRKLKIRVIDKYPELFTGIPYGERSGKSVLLINALESFIPEPHRGVFVDWLKANKDALINEFLNAGGGKADKWLKDNLSSINKGEWDGLFVPRFFFGKYISQMAQASIDGACKKDIIEFKFSTEEVIDVKREGSHFHIETKSGNGFYSDSVILSVGSLPTRKIYGDQSLVLNDRYLVLNDIYKKSLPDNLKTLKSFIHQDSQKRIDFLLLGANASGLEFLYKTMDEAEIRDVLDSVTVLSSQGIMPDSHVDCDGLEKFHPNHLTSLGSDGSLTAEKIADAAYKDIQKARELSLGAASTVGVISKEVGALLSRLGPEEARSFACLHGNNIGRMQRCAGSHYTSSLDELMGLTEYRHIAGRFSNLESDKANNGLVLEYKDTKSGEVVRHPKVFNVVINCMGATDLDSKDTPVLFKNLIASELVIPNGSGIGFEVNPDFEASENFYVLGPLLAGNVIDGKPLWHLEHCGRIIWSSTLMIDRFIQKALPV